MDINDIRDDTGRTEPGIDGDRSLVLVREMYALARELMTSEVQYYSSHGRLLAARLHHMILSQDPAGDLGFFDDSYL